MTVLGKTERTNINVSNAFTKLDHFKAATGRFFFSRNDSHFSCENELRKFTLNFPLWILIFGIFFAPFSFAFFAVEFYIIRSNNFFIIVFSVLCINFVLHLFVYAKNCIFRDYRATTGKKSNKVNGFFR